MDLKLFTILLAYLVSVIFATQDQASRERSLESEMPVMTNSLFKIKKIPSDELEMDAISKSNTYSKCFSKICRLLLKHEKMQKNSKKLVKSK